MVRTTACRPLVFDYVELRIRSALAPSDRLTRDAGLALPICRLL